MYEHPYKERDDEALLEEVVDIHAHHMIATPTYNSIVRKLFGLKKIAEWEDLPWLPSGLFKNAEIRNDPASDGQWVQSSGTKGKPSRIYIDFPTSMRQQEALKQTLEYHIGNKPPLFIADARGQLKTHNARYAGVAGMMRVGRNPVFLLNSNMSINPDALDRLWATENAVVFGFTWVVYKHLVLPLMKAGLLLKNSVLIHSGGWKKMEADAVGAEELRKNCQSIGLIRILNFYGMVEQLGSVWVGKDASCLIGTRFAYAVIRHPVTLRPVPDGAIGLIQLISPIPLSYPGHSVLTEDLGRIVSRSPLAIEVIGRLPKLPTRGCSDVD